METETATLSCVVSKPNIKPKWFKDGKEIRVGGRYEIKVEETRHTLIIRDADLKDEAEYSVQLEDKSTAGTVFVEGSSSPLHLHDPRSICMTLISSQDLFHVLPGKPALALLKKKSRTPPLKCLNFKHRMNLLCFILNLIQFYKCYLFKFFKLYHYSLNCWSLLIFNCFNFTPIPFYHIHTPLSHNYILFTPILPEM